MDPIRPSSLAPLQHTTRRELPPLGSLHGPNLHANDTNRLRPLGQDAPSTALGVNRLRPLEIPTSTHEPIIQRPIPLPMPPPVPVPAPMINHNIAYSVQQIAQPQLDPPPRYGQPMDPPQVHRAIPTNADFRPLPPALPVSRPYRDNDLGQQPRHEQMDEPSSYDNNAPVPAAAVPSHSQRAKRNELVSSGGGAPDPSTQADFRSPGEFASNHDVRRRSDEDIDDRRPYREDEGYARDASMSPPTLLSPSIDQPPPNAIDDSASPMPPKTPKTPRVPMTPGRTQIFSPHAVGGGKTFQHSEEPPPPPPPQVDPPMASIDELLAPQALQIYRPFFARLGYTDLAAILAMDDDKLDWMLDEVEVEAENVGGIRMKGGHKNHILTRIKQERMKTNSRKKRPIEYNESLRSPTNGSNSHVAAIAALPTIPSQANTNIVMIEGMKGLMRHWCCCFGLCVLLIVLSTVFIVLYEQIGRDGDGSTSSGVNGSDVSSVSSGGWKFVYIISILGFVFGGIAFLMAILTWLRNPAHRSCGECKSLLPDCGAACKSCCASCPSVSDCECDCCQSCGLGECWQQVKECLGGSFEACREECHLPQCDCGDCCQCDSMRQCYQECGCQECCQCQECCDCKECCQCENCCQDCEMPSCECDCWSVEDETNRRTSDCGPDYTTRRTYLSSSSFFLSILQSRYGGRVQRVLLDLIQDMLLSM